MVVLALGLRLLYLPFHLAQEEHLDTDGHSHALAGVTQVDHDHNYDHDHEHSPHPAADHGSELTAHEAPTRQKTCGSLAHPPTELGSIPTYRGIRFVAGPEPLPPKHALAVLPPSRGPPVTA